MSEFIELHQDALCEALGFVGEAIIYNGNTYQGIVSFVKLSDELGDGGFLETLDSNIIVSKRDFSTAPVAGQLINAGGQEMRIITVDADEVSFFLGCKTATR